MFKHTLTRIAVTCMAVAALCSGCVDIVSWSPDGRYLAFIDDDENLYFWDSLTSATRRVAQGVVFCRFSPSGELLYANEAADEPHGMFPRSIDPNAEGVLHTSRPDDPGAQPGYVADISGTSVGISGDGRYCYFLKIRESDQNQKFCQVWEFDLGNNKSTMLVEGPNELQQPEGDATGARVLYSGVRENDTGFVALFDKAAASSKDLEARAGRVMWWPTWLDDTHVLWIDAPATGGSEGDAEWGDLTLYSTLDGSKRVLQSGVANVARPGLSADRKRILVTKQPGTQTTRLDADIQVYSVDAATGDATPVTHELLGAAFAQFRPTGNAIAYMSPPDIDSIRIPVILDMEKQTRTFPIFKEDRRRYFLGEMLLEAGRPAEALIEHQGFANEHPNDDLAIVSWYRVAELTLKSPSPDFDVARNAFRKIRGTEPAAALRPNLWRTTDASATDPAGDLIRAYGNDAARAHFEFDTDATRDLTGLSVRWSKTRLFLTIDYASARDLRGLAFCDTVILMDYATPQEGWKAIGPLTDWDRGAEWGITFRHWFDSGRQSQYAIQVLNGKGEPFYQISASGYGGAEFPPVQVEDIIDDAVDGDTGTLVLSLSRDEFGIPKDLRSDIAIQVCTFKGGVEERVALERQREKGGPAPLCDVADAFGAENTRERIDQDLQTNAANPAYRAVIRGSAIVTHAPEE